MKEELSNDLPGEGTKAQNSRMLIFVDTAV